MFSHTMTFVQFGMVRAQFKLIYDQGNRITGKDYDTWIDVIAWCNENFGKEHVYKTGWWMIEIEGEPNISCFKLRWC